AAALLLAAVALLAGCGGRPEVPAATEGTSVAAPAPSCTPPAAVARALPAAFPLQVALPRGTVLTDVGDVGGSPYVTGLVPGDVAPVLEHFRTALPAAGAFVGRDEDEGRSGQLTFLSGSVEGGLQVARQRCPEGTTAFTLTARSAR
ncbi:MAG: hypothetical protein JWO60_2699, partial [Frankiales bacterium]|nr:hypothetical protein [Frankiales bacterium]